MREGRTSRIGHSASNGVDSLKWKAYAQVMLYRGLMVNRYDAHRVLLASLCYNVIHPCPFFAQSLIARSRTHGRATNAFRISQQLHRGYRDLTPCRGPFTNVRSF